MIRARTATQTKAIQAMKVRTATGLKPVAFASLRNASALKRFFTQSGAIAVTASPASVFGAAAVEGVTTVVTNATIAQPTGGASPYTYTWTKIADDGGTWTIQNPASDTTRFNCAAIGIDTTYTATFRCTVTDVFGGTGTVDVAATAINYGGIYR